MKPESEEKEMTLGKILAEIFGGPFPINGPVHYQEYISESLKHVENIPFVRKGKLDYTFSNDTVKI